ncbi:hypothetical protein NL473_28290, partial [Klebsiella pneumoniae]|nr:hypothetical protein [Klebsiella pneumoniae]MCP6594524.1 hypothetical protein [Klebsiella pneumoniae]
EERTEADGDDAGDDDADERAAGRRAVTRSGRAHSFGSGGPNVNPRVERDETMTHPRCVFQIVKRHFSRYTPEMVEQICGVSREQFIEV